MASGKSQQVLWSETDYENSTTEAWGSEPVNRLLAALDTIIPCLAVLNNGVVIAVMLLRRRVFSSFTNRLILHQSFIDAIAGVIYFLHHVVIKSKDISVSKEGNINDQLLCRFVYSDLLIWSVNVTSTYNLVAISLERFMATCYPVKHRNTWTKRKFKIVVSSTLIVGCFCGVSILVGFEPHQGHCQKVTNPFLRNYFVYMVRISVDFLVPITVMIFSYTRIAILMSKKVANPANGAPVAMTKAKKNLIGTAMLISIMFVVCWTPIQLLTFDGLLFDELWKKELFYQVSVLLVACNMLVNPVIYCFKYQHFRSQLKDLVLARLQRNRVDILAPDGMLGNP